MNDREGACPGNRIFENMAENTKCKPADNIYLRIPIENYLNADCRDYADLIRVISTISVRPINLALVAQLHHRQDGSNRNGLTRLVIDIHVEFDDSFFELVVLAFFLLDFLLNGKSHTYRGTSIDRLDKATFLKAVIQQHGAFASIYKQTGSSRKDKVSVCYALFEDRSIKGSDICMCIEMIPGYIRKVYDIAFGDGALMSKYGIAYLQLFKMLAKQVWVSYWLSSARLELLGDL